MTIRTRTLDLYSKIKWRHDEALNAPTPEYRERQEKKRDRLLRTFKSNMGHMTKEFWMRGRGAESEQWRVMKSLAEYGPDAAQWLDPIPMRRT
jgi:hypothetical protein